MCWDELETSGKLAREIVVTPPVEANYVLVSPMQMPTLRPDYILVKVVCVALNPTDWKKIQQTAFDYEKPLTVGCDFSGVVEEVGSEVTRPFKPGDRVWGFAHSCNTAQPEDGSFAEYIVAKGNVTVRIPDNMGFAEAASLGVQVYTVGQGLYQSLKLPWPTEPTKPENKFPVLIYGGSTAMGTLAIQMAKLSGLEVITTCSLKNFDFVKSFGADKVFDYRSPTVGSDIRQYTNNKLRYVWDTIGEGQAPQICADALSSSSSPEFSLHYSTIVLGEFPRADVKTDITLVYTIFNEAFNFYGSIKVDVMPQNFPFAEKWGSLVGEFFGEKRLVPHPVEVRGGLEKIGEGLKDLEEGRVSAKKLVYRVSDS
ncbi:putative zinc-binding oxidoreductase ToxD [Talaromyces proteolyticus]|uniref:Zinc-binding oxidoreductase ToxD n=1 Tax=Talaromyces proteolyticus TaxID=1131652 RepID=A0AAD4KZJ0_9EURO|nr:putative zinc-binding oxidoreductase ToxD [Talaromyces proteolyticus]KAH8704778.1 putative zinc-binding oxidoreductase ToxD [Talaromyces proteolyticus]